MEKKGCPYGFVTLLGICDLAAPQIAIDRAWSRCRTTDTNDRSRDGAHAAAVTERHVSMAEARKARCVLAEIRWR
jgi:hypothetical protein